MLILRKRYSFMNFAVNRNFPNPSPAVPFAQNPLFQHSNIPIGAKPLSSLDKMSDEEIVKLNIPTGIPLVYELDKNLKPVKHYYLGDPEEVKKAMNKVANQGKSKK